jgi:PKD repeat protein
MSTITSTDTITSDGTRTKMSIDVGIDRAALMTGNRATAHGGFGRGPSSPHTATSRSLALLALLLILPAIAQLPVSEVAHAATLVCDAGGPYYGSEGAPLPFDGTGSEAPGVGISSYSWSFGDGTTGSGAQPTHVYASGGLYVVTLTVTDQVGLQSSCDTTADIEAELEDLPRPLVIADYIDLVENELPPLDPSMLDVPDGPDWFAAMSIDRVAGAVDDHPPDTILFEGDVWIAFDAPESTSTRFARLDFGRDYLRYVSQSREFRWEWPHEAVSETQALDLFWSVAEDLGLPGDELGEPLVDTVVGVGFDEASGMESELEVERLVTLPRRISGRPVFGSLARVAISNLGEPARLLVRWRRFGLAPGLVRLDRDDVVRAIAERLWSAEQGVEIDVDIDLGYSWTPAGHVPVARVSVSDLSTVLEGGLLEPVPVAMATTSAPGETNRPRLALHSPLGTARGRTLLQLELPVAQHARLAIYDASGRLVRRLADRRFAAGRHEFLWDGRDTRDRPVANGVYLVQLAAESGKLVHKLVLVR